MASIAKPPSPLHLCQIYSTVMIENVRRREQLRNDYGYRSCVTAEFSSGSYFTPFETCRSHHKPHTKHHLTVNSEVFMNNKQVCMIDEMINIISDLLDLVK